MDVYVNDTKMNQSKLGTRLEQAHNAEDSYVFGIRKYGSGMGIGKVEHKSFAWFCIFEMKTSKTLSQELTQLHVIIS